MADELNNKKNIDDSKKSLNEFNDALKESIDYAKQLSKTVSSIPSELGLSERKNKSLIRGAQDYNKILNDTLKLSDKIAKGKAKEKEVTDQLANLQKQYKKFVEENSASFDKGGRFLLKQKKLREDITKLQIEEAVRQNKIATSQDKIEEILSKITEQDEKRLSGGVTTKANAEKLLKVLKEQLTEEENTIRALETQSKSEGKKLSTKVKEKKIIDDSIESYNEIVSLFKTLLLLSNQVAESVQKTAFDKLRSKDLKEFGEGIKDISSILSSVGALFKPLVDFAFKISDQTTQFQKNLVLSQDEAYDLRQDFNDMAVSSGDIAINMSRLSEANAALGKQLGFSSKFSADLNVQFVKLTKQLGLSEEAAAGLAKLSIATGATLEDTKNIAYETVQGLSSQYGLQLTQREVLEEIGKLSGQTLAMFKANPKALAEAVAQARLLGTNLDTVRKQASSLLDFETSIENELQAELLTGQQFNLERARSAALTGDMTTAMKELNNQNIDFNKFSNMNVIAQDKVAAALGLSSDELSDQLLKQQYMNKSREEVVALAGEEVAKRVEALSAQDKFNLAVEKMQDILGKIAGGTLGKLVDMMATLAESTTVVSLALGVMAGISMTKLIVGLAASAVQAGMLAAGAVTATTALTAGVATAIIVAGIAAIMAQYASAKEEAIEPTGDMFSSKGKTIVSTKEGGLFELSGNDEFAAHPKLGDMLNNANRQTIIAQDNSALLDELRALRDEMKGTKEGINKLNNKEGVVKINGQAAGTAQMIGNYNLA